MTAKRAQSRTKSKRSDEPTGLDRWSQTSGKSSKKSSADVHQALYALAGLVVILAIALVVSFPINTTLSRGLDVSSGTSLTFSASKADGSTPTEDELTTAVATLKMRLQDLGFSDARVQADGTTITAQIPGTTVDAQQLGEELAQSGKLEFVRMDDIGDADARARINAGQTNVSLEQDTYTPFLDGSAVTSASATQTTISGTPFWVINLSFDDDGAAVLAEVTEDLAASGGQLAVVLDGKVISAPAVQEAITEGDVSFSGGFTEDQARSIEMIVSSGSLPVSLTFMQSVVEGPLLGREALTQGAYALAVAAILVTILLLVCYRGLALLVLGSVLVSLLVWIGGSAALSRADVLLVTLPALAGAALTALITSAGSLLLLGGFLEKVRQGRSLRTSSTTGLSHVSVGLIEAYLVLLVTFFIPSVVTTGSVREFALSAVVGTVGAFVALLLFEKPLLQIVAVKSMPEHAHLWGVKIPSESVDSHEDSSSTATYHAKQLTVLSLALCVVAIAGCAVRSELVVSLGESVLATPVLGIALLVGLLIYCMVMALRLDLKIALSALVGIVFSVVVVLGMSSLLNTTITDQLAGGLLFSFAWSLWCNWSVMRRVNDDLASERKGNKKAGAPKISLWRKVANSIRFCSPALTVSLVAVIVMSIALLVATGAILFTLAAMSIIGSLVGIYAVLGVTLPLMGFWKMKESQWATAERRQTRQDR